MAKRFRVRPRRKGTPPYASRRSLQFQSLEDRRLLAVTAGEQHFVYLLNRARHDPEAYEQEVNLPVDLSYVTPRPPLAVNDNLFDSAGFHADEMATHNYFSHQSQVTGDWPNKMARDAGYPLPDWWASDSNFIESLAAGYANAGAALYGLIYDGGAADPGHRNHLMAIHEFWADNREIGVGHAAQASASFGNYWAIHTAHRSPDDQFLTGVVFNDANNNQRYDLGEGLGDVNVAAGSASTKTNAHGGWSIPIADGEYLVTASGGSFQGTSSVPVKVQGKNIAIDFRSGQPGGQINFDAWVNTAPTLDTAGDPTLKPVLRNDANPPGDVVASFIGDAISDFDPAPQEGVAVVGVGGAAAGVWQYSIDSGTTWSNLGAVSSSSARLLGDTDLVRFKPDPGAVGAATISYRAWDRTSGEAGGVGDLSGGTGGSTAFSAASETATLTVLTANAAPTLNATGDRTLPAIAEDTTVSAGAVVRDILGATALDSDPGTKVGLALVAAESANGVWEYSTNDGAAWSDVGAVSSSAALLLRDIDRLRFLPDADYNGSPTIKYHVWDQMFDAAGGKVDLAAGVGGSTSYSTASDTARIDVTPVNDAPVLDAEAQPKMSPIAENTGFNNGERVDSILGGIISDVDAGALEGIAITGVTGSGQWWFQNDGQWRSGSTSPNFAWLLKATDRVQFVPDTDWSGTASFTFRAWDQTTGPDTSGIWADVSNPSRYGGTKAYSAASLTATLFVGPAGQAPIVQSIARTDANPTSLASVDFTVTFNEDVVNVDPGDFHAVTSGSVSGQVSAAKGGGSSYTVTVANVSGVGTLALAFQNGVVDIRDTVGNKLDLSGFAGSEVYNVGSLELTLSLTKSSIAENAGAGAAVGTITRIAASIDAPLVVNLASSNPSEAAVPLTVTIPAGQTSAEFEIDAVDDALLDGSQMVIISADSAGYGGAAKPLTVTDHETLQVTLNPTSGREGGGPDAVVGTVRRSNTDTANALVVSLSSSDTGEATVPATVSIPAGAASVSFPVDLIDDELRDGTQTVIIAASAERYVGGSASLAIIDRDASAPHWQNAAMRWDVDGNGSVTVNDLLELVRFLRDRVVPYNLPPTDASEETPPPYVDVDGDDRVTFNDLLELVQRLRDDFD